MASSLLEQLFVLAALLAYVAPLVIHPAVPKSSNLTLPDGPVKQSSGLYVLMTIRKDLLSPGANMEVLYFLSYSLVSFFRFA